MAYKENSPIPVVEGGTGAQTFTSHGVLLGNTTGAITATAAGTTGQVLTGVTGSAPTFQTPASTSITITGDSGGGLSGTSFTFTGGSTGLTFAGAGTTETLGGTLAIANGGTNATSMSTSTGIVKYDGTRLVTSSTAKIDSSNRQTNTSQPAFLYYQASTASNVTGDGTNYTMGSSVALTQLYDQNGNCTTGGIFTAPVTGKYLFTINVLFQNATTSESCAVQLATTANNFTEYNNSSMFTGNNGFCVTVLAPMTAGDTAHAGLIVSSGSKNVNIYGGGDPRTHFSGYLVC